VVACFGAARIAKFSDVFTSDAERDPKHPARVNYRGVAALAALAAEAGRDQRIVCRCSPRHQRAMRISSSRQWMACIIINGVVNPCCLS